MNKYYITESNDKQFNAANKAREDVEVCFEELSFSANNMYINLLQSKNPKVKLIDVILSELIKIKSNDCVYLQYPYYKNHNKVFFILRILKKMKNINIIAIIHDLDSLRYKKGRKYISEEISKLNLCDYVISHNEIMTNWLKENGCRSNIIDLKLFDYILHDYKKCENNIRKTDVIYAGNLDKNKSGFIYKLINRDSLNFTMNLYGPNFNGNIDNYKVKYCGKYSAEELIKHVEGKFGLIWDGIELNTCFGETGEYTKYNNPHKLSMYIAAGLPVICWTEMAISKFVLTNGIGICIESLENIDKVLLSIDEEKYKVMVKNIMCIRNKIIDGMYTKDVLKKINKF